MDSPIVAQYSRAKQNQKRAAAPEGMSYCNLCDTYKSVSEFRKLTKKSKNGLAHRCKECAKKNDAKYRERNVVKNRKNNYGITEKEYQELKRGQEGICAICRKPETFIVKGKAIDLCVDHDHTTGLVRGLLCMSCNQGLGYFKDSVESLSNAIDYLRNTAS